MNAKARKYYQDMNKENLFNKQFRGKHNADRDPSKASYQILAVQNHSRIKGSSPSQKAQTLQKMQSRTNLMGKQFHSKDKNTGVRFPKICREDPLPPNNAIRKNHCKSFKKIRTEPAELDDDFLQMKTLSPNHNMKEVLLGIVKNKENRHLASIDEQIDKLDILTKRYSCLRQDLVSIQEDMLTMSFKQKIGKDSASVSSVYMY